MFNFIETAQAVTEPTKKVSGAAVSGEKTETVAVEEHASKGGVAGTLGLDVQVFVGQLINFTIIFLILWFFVFKPVAKKLTERTDKIEKALKDADLTTKEREEFGIWKEEEMSKVKGKAGDIIAQAKNDADAVRQETLRQTKEEQTKLVAQAKAAIEKEKEKAIKEAKAEIAELVIMATEKVIGKKLDEKTDKHLIEEAIKKV